MIRVQLKLLIAQREIKTGTKITYDSLGQQVGISRITIGRIAEGKTDRIDFLTLDKLCAYFGCTVGDILVYELDAPATN